MISIERRRELVTSTPALLVMAMIAATIMELMNPGPFSLTGVAIRATFFGIVLVFITKQRIKRVEAATGLSDAAQQGKLDDALRTATLPTDKALLKALPGFLDLRQQDLETQQRQKIFFVVVGVIITVIAATANLAFLLFGVFFALIYRYNNSLMEKTAGNIAELRRQLK